MKERTKNPYRKKGKPVYLVYVESGRVPRHYHKDLSDALTEAKRLTKLMQKKAFVIEYGAEPVVLGHVDKLGAIHSQGVSPCA